MQLSVYRGNSGIQAIMNNNSRRLAEQDESKLMASGIPYTIIRAGVLKNTPGRRGFSYEKVSSSLKLNAVFHILLAIIPYLTSFEAYGCEILTQIK